MPSTFSLDDIDRIIGGKIGTFDVPCPLCGPYKSAQGQRRKVLRIWRLEENFAGYRCARCLVEGYARRNGGRRTGADQQRIVELKAAAAAHDAEYRKHQSEKAAWLWSKALRPAGTIVQSYLANRGVTRPLPMTIRYLPAHGGYAAAMICVFGAVFEDADGNVAEPANVTAVHLTLLRADGSKANVEPNKKIVGPSAGKPIVLAPPGDGHAALAITEGVEDGLTAAQALGIAVWAAGSAGNMLKIAPHVPDFMESVTIFAHSDESGRLGAKNLADSLAARGFPEIRIEGLKP